MTVRTTTQLATANVKVQKAIRRAISSQASQEWVEGSTTRSHPPDRRMKAISAGGPYYGSRYSLYCCDGKVTEFAKLFGNSVVHDFSKQPGQTVQLDRYRFWGAPGTKDSRERTADQTLGTASSRSIVKDKVLVTLRELIKLIVSSRDEINTNGSFAA